MPSLLGLAPDAYERYIEPFAGSAVLFFALKPRTSVLGDSNQSLMSYYRWVRKAPAKVHSVAESANRADDYYRMREIYNDLPMGVERAGLFLYLNNACFNGLYRCNRSGRFNVPRGTRQRALPTLSALKETSVALQGVNLLTRDFEETLSTAKEGDFVYVDPPFFSESHHESGEFGQGTFRSRDFPRLFASCARADKAGARCLITLPEAVEPPFDRRWSRVEHPVVYHLAGNRSETPAVEVVWRNY